MCQQCLIGFCFVISQILIQSNCAKAQSFMYPDSSNKERLDTIFIAPDTIKTTRIDTVFEYFDDVPRTLPKTIPIHKKTPEIGINLGMQAGLDITRLFPMYNTTSIQKMIGVQGMGFYNSIFLQISLNAFSGFSTSNSITKQYTKIHNWTDTIKTVIDEYIEIIGKDTIKTQVIKKTLFPKSDTLHSDSVFSHKNSYSIIDIPIVFGYLFKMKKTILGIGIGPDIRITLANTTNMVSIGDTSFVKESRYFKKSTLAIATMLVLKQQIMKKIWLSGGMNGIIPIESNYQSFNKTLFQTNLTFFLGIDYFFRI